MTRTAWALDLGTTNSGVARWDAAAHRPRLLELPSICRQPGGEDHLEAPRLVPSAVLVRDGLDWRTRLGDSRLLRRRVFWGQLADIGRPALAMQESTPHPGFAATFKRHLGTAPLRPIARGRGRAFSARDVARLYMRELLREVKATTGERIRELTVTTPVEAFEGYRAEISQIARSLGVRKLRFVDEPVAAAIGYGLGVRHERLVLIVDFGGGTLDLALVTFSAKGASEGTCRVLAKEGRPVGGELVDRWLLDEFCRRMDYVLRPDAADEEAFWYRTMLAEARRVKERMFFVDGETFNLTPPEELRAFEARIRGAAPELEVARGDVVEILAGRGLYDVLDECLDGIDAQAQALGIALSDVDDVLMVGGSTLLPDVYGRFEQRFGRDRVRAWQPFEAVAFGACAFAADQVTQSDFIVHDYAFVTYDPDTHRPQHTVVVPRGTRFPTAHDFWKRQLVPTCSLGEPEKIFKLVICEVGRAEADERRFGWDAQGRVRKLGGEGGEQALIVPLNESNPTLGYLNPPHPPSDRRPRLDIALGVNSDRWLVATVQDLRTNKQLMKGEPVVRLL